MELAEAIRKANQILDEECKRPTSEYRLAGVDFNQTLKDFTEGKTKSLPPGQAILDSYRATDPRMVLEHSKYEFYGTNYELLRTLFGQVGPGDRDAFIEAILARVASGGTYWFRVVDYKFPRFKSHTCELPLIGEFCIRSGYTTQLFAALTQVKIPTVAIANLMMQLEETISLNFNVFSENELQQIPSWLAPLRDMADKQTHSASGTVHKMVENPHYKPGREDEANQIVKSVDGIAEECVQALYFYLKGVLQKSSNLDIENDKTKVEAYLVKLGFSGEMLEALNAAEDDYKSTSTPFELKNSLGHLRSFLEHLHRASAKSIAAANGDTETDRWGDATLYLRKCGLLTKQHEAFVASLYTLISDESIHPLGTGPEYARLLRNVVIEYGVMFLSVLDKKGIRITP